MASEERDQDLEGLEADLEADLQELEREFGAEPEDAGGGPSRPSPGSAPGPQLEDAPAVDAEDLELGATLAFDALMRRYAVNLGIPEEEIPADVIEADEQGRKIAAALAPVANKYLPHIVGRYQEEIRAVVVVGFACGSTMYRLHGLAESHEEEEAPGEDTGDGDSSGE